MADPTLVIKKYGNRRLYDTERSQYITLDDLSHLIKAGRDVKVVDAKTNVNLTKTVLLQIITEQEKDKDLLPISFLKQMIQLGDTASVRESLQRYLSLSLDSFLSAQQDFEQRYRSMTGNLMNPMMWLMPPFGQVPGMSRSAAGQVPTAAEAPPAATPEPEPEPEPAPDFAEQEPPVPIAAADTAEAAGTKEQIQTLKAQVDQIQLMLAKLTT